jgi:hypothetical protein
MTEGNSIEYIKYLEKLGFTEDSNGVFSKKLV